MVSVATIGFFDGVHEGHRFVVSQVIQLAKRIGGRSLVVTFSNHPASLFCPERQPQLLTTPEEKREKLLQCGADEVLMFDFNQQLASKTAAEFMLMLKEEHNVSHLLLGYDNRFGRPEKAVEGDSRVSRSGIFVEANKRSGDKQSEFPFYVEIGKQLGITVLKLKPLLPVVASGVALDSPTSSTLIRNLLHQGALEAANRRLGYHYSLQGEVITGFQIGRKIGFPTANLRVSANKLIPRAGVYAVSVSLQPSSESASVPCLAFPWLSPSLPAMLNIGQRPTFHGHETTIEVHILDFSGDLYGEVLRIDFLKRIRDERKFDSSQELIEQLKKDKAEVLEITKKTVL